MKDILGIELKTGDTVVGRLASKLIAGTVGWTEEDKAYVFIEVMGKRGMLYEPVYTAFSADDQLLKVASYGETGEDQVGVVQDAGQDESRSTRDRLYDDAGC